MHVFVADSANGRNIVAGLGLLEAVEDEKLAKSGRQVAAGDCGK